MIAYAVGGKAIPEIPFDAGESYSGLLPISTKADESKKLFFWFWPSKNQSVDNEIVIWLNGGPGSSSLFGFLQELGPFMWAPGTARPYPNTWTPVNLTNVVWIEYPVGVGYTEGTPTATSEEELAQEFLGFWQNFMTLFSLQGRKVYIMGESYAGYYTPYIGAAMLDAANTTYYDFRGAILVSPLITAINSVVADSVGAASFVKDNNNILNLNDEYLAFLNNKSAACGYDDFLSTYLVYPPKSGPLPFPFQVAENGYGTEDCDTRNVVTIAAGYQNQCASPYNILYTCPLRSDVIANAIPGTEPYFNRDDVKAALHVPVTTAWMDSGRIVFANSSNVGFSPQNDRSLMPTISALPKIIEASNRTIIITGAMDTVILHTSIELGIQNMTWNGAQGFQSGEMGKFVVDPFDEYVPETYSALGQVGKTHTERGLTYIVLQRSGHFVPTDVPGGFYKAVEFLLGRRDGVGGGTSFYWYE
ncbi:alpha/beta-hydrolase [Cadophora sp. DSE1049]|nr:alpha/beta-hydrolase [Cadophora sp. DSE1049]